MRKLILFFLLLGELSYVYAQDKSASASKLYRAEREKINDLVHTKLNVSFDYDKLQMYGEAWITLTPHFYDVSKVSLDAKAMIINKVKMDSIDLPYHYDDYELTVELPKEYTRDQEYTIYIDYIARPEQVKEKGSDAIKGAKGLYFVSPEGEDTSKPTQIWTQGEVEANSCWFPTIDAPNQKTSQEIYMTVPSKYVTLSNGLLLEQTENDDGTRTDYWKMDQKHAPYLFFMGVGDYAVIKDSWRDLEVDYYVDHKYEDVASTIFGMTPKMIDYFSDLTGVNYPWDKYSQMVSYDYVSGAMENTTAVLHSERAYQDASQLVDENTWERVIAHELFHHWFGDYVTCSSWSNLTVNESFANYSEYLWFEHAYGKDLADSHLYSSSNLYLSATDEYKKDLVRFYYDNVEDMFDLVSYNKGGAILHMLRSYLGDDAFFAGLKNYLNTNKFGTGEAHQLRIALEQISGKDLNWFFNQWYFGSGHIKFSVSKDYNMLNKTVAITINQTGDKIFTFPLTIDIYEGEGKTKVKKSYQEWVDQREISFTYEFSQEPKLIHVGAKEVLLAEINNTAMDLDNYIYQYNNTNTYVSRKKAIEYLSDYQDNKGAFEAIVSSLNDPFYEIRILALDKIDLKNKHLKGRIIKTIEKIAQDDSKTLVRAKAIEVLGKLVDKRYTEIFTNGLKSNSNAMVNSSIIGLYYLNKDLLFKELDNFTQDQRELCANSLVDIFINEKDTKEFPFVAKHVLKGMFFTRDREVQKRYDNAFNEIIESNSIEANNNLVNQMVKLGNQYRSQGLNQIFVKLIQKMIVSQDDSDNSNKDQIVQLAKEGISKLI